jgi:hypothetical protein
MQTIAFILMLAAPGDKPEQYTLEPPTEMKSLVFPLKTERRGRESVRTYVLKPGDSFETPRGVRTWVRWIDAKGVVMSRWSDPLVKHRLGYPTGSRETLYILDINARAQKVRFEVRTKMTLAWWEVMAF